MSTKVSYRDGGKTSEEGLYRLLSKFWTEDGVIADGDLLVTQNGTPNNTVTVATGDIVIGKNDPATSLPDFCYSGWVTVAESVTISANSSGNPRIDAIVAYIDKSVQDSSQNDNPGVLKFKDVVGTPASTPAAPAESDIQTSVGASNPYIILAHVAVANGFSSITNSNITDKRPFASTLSRYISDTNRDFVVSGLVASQTSGLVGQISAGRSYIGGQVVFKPIIAKTFTASKDTYIDLPKTAKPTSTNDYTFTEVTNGSASPALTSGSIRLAKVVTDGTGITSVVSTGTDSLGNPIRNLSSVSMPAGSVIQSVSGTLSSPTTGTGTIPFDNTIPQNTEGTEFLSKSFTPMYSNSLLQIEAQLCLASSAARSVAVTILKDSDANAMAVMPEYFANADVMKNIRIRYEMVSGTVSPITFRVRAGADSAATITINGTAGGPYFNGTLATYINIKEIKA